MTDREKELLNEIKGLQKEKTLLQMENEMLKAKIKAMEGDDGR